MIFYRKVKKYIDTSNQTIGTIKTPNSKDKITRNKETQMTGQHEPL